MGKQIPVSKDKGENWRNNDIQFPRLISELQAAGAFTADVILALEASMDLQQYQIFQVVERADKVWEDIKARTSPPGG